MFNVSCLKRRFGVSLSASRRFAVSDTACCSFLTMTSEVQGERRAELARAMLSRSLHSRCISNASQRYYISIAVYEYISKIILSIFVLRGHLVIWSFVKIENRLSKSATII